jgi:hypothetical protein
MSIEIFWIITYYKIYAEILNAINNLVKQWCKIKSSTRNHWDFFLNMCTKWRYSWPSQERSKRNCIKKESMRFNKCAWIKKRNELLLRSEPILLHQCMKERSAVSSSRKALFLLFLSRLDRVLVEWQVMYRQTHTHTYT